MRALLLADCRDEMPKHGPYDMVFADPPYGDTALPWDNIVGGWQEVARACVSPSGSMWVFGSFRYFLAEHRKFEAAGWRLAQEVVWEKHNGSGFAADRFRRVHELAVHYYPDTSRWSDIYNSVQKTMDAKPRKVTRRAQPAHLGGINPGSYETVAGGPRIMRSVIKARSCHGRAIHPTEKPVDLLTILLRTSCRPGGVVGDFFAGSGALGVAAAECGLSYVGCEIEADYYAAAQQRLNNLSIQPSLFVA